MSKDIITVLKIVPLSISIILALGLIVILLEIRPVWIRGIIVKIKLSGVVAAASWASVLVMAWLLFAGTVEWSSQRVGIFILFILIAIGSGLIYTSDGQTKRNS